ncbi:MAG: beta-galactosidase trimerization domain-containing protein [Abitibacteriaceae bacterium]|nr:beta-galactosidase trimerization domain-containing protein [Abditibacteriaceae bacterium]MBV9868809.1 beta-galactosidase trimerization domain-containing protein [Abditibacteriaceae bacterium]
MTSRQIKNCAWAFVAPLCMIAGLAAVTRFTPAQAQNAGASAEYQQGLAWAQAVAVPDNLRPRQFVIADYLIGPTANQQPQDLDAGLQTLAALGMNTAEIRRWGALSNQVAAHARQVGITRFRRAIYSPLPPNPDRNPSLYFSWNTDALTPAKVDAWARDQVRQSEAFGMPASDVALFHMADEPGWYFPYITRQFASSPARLQMFHNFLQSKGLQPGDVGAQDWSQVLPLTAAQLQARNYDLPGRRLFYWTTRYPTETASDAFKTWSDALRRQFNPNLLITSNWNNPVDRYYYPSPGRKIGNNQETGPDAAMGMMDWMDVGRKGALTALWTEDWFTDQDAQSWSYYADALHSAAQQSGVQFGGYITGRKLGDNPAGGKYRALALIGHGAKAIDYFCYGPESQFPGNTYSNNRNAYGAIAGANRLIGRAESLLYPGQRLPARIAILLPRSAQAWDETSTINQFPVYQQEVKGIHFALTHSHYPVDFIDEENLASGDFARRNYFILYVTSPNLAAAAQTALQTWINNGGTAIFSPGAAAADEYNSPSGTLNAARGVRAIMLPHTGNAVGAVQVSFRDQNFGNNLTLSGPSAPLQVTGGTTLAQFANGSPALVSNRVGQGLALSYGFWPGTAYYASVQRPGPAQLPQGWNDALRSVITAVPRVTRVGRPVDVDTDLVEASRLDSTAGIAVTLLNWTNQPQGQIAVTVHNVGTVTSVGSAEQGTVPFTQNGTDLRVSLPLRDVDVLMIRH